MSDNKTMPTGASTAAFIKSIEDDQRRKDCQVIAKMMREITGNRARMWGDSIVGYGEYHYKYKSGREGEFLVTGFSPRKQNLSIYIMPGFGSYAALLSKLGRHKHSVSCLYIKRLSDINENILYKLIARSVEDMRRNYLITK